MGKLALQVELQEIEKFRPSHICSMPDESKIGGSHGPAGMVSIPAICVILSSVLPCRGVVLSLGCSLSLYTTCVELPGRGLSFLFRKCVRLLGKESVVKFIDWVSGIPKTSVYIRTAAPDTTARLTSVQKPPTRPHLTILESIWYHLWWACHNSMSMSSMSPIILQCLESFAARIGLKIASRQSHGSSIEWRLYRDCKVWGQDILF